MHSKVAVLDVDYHCGNGTIGIFWHDPSVYVCSINADPDKEYPYTCGFADQVRYLIGGLSIGDNLVVLKEGYREVFLS